MADRSLQFQLIGQHPDTFLGALAALWEIESPVRSLTLSRSRIWPREPGPVPALFASVMFHFSVAFFLNSVPLWWLSPRVTRLRWEPEETDTPVVYDLTKLNLADYLPVERPPGPGGAPGSGSADGQVVRGTTTQDPRVTIVSNPPKPDNNRQTIIQRASPEDLKISRETRLPDVIVVDVTAERQAPPMPVPLTSKPNPVLSEKPAGSLPAPSAARTAAPEVTLLAVVPLDSTVQLDTRLPLPPAMPAAAPPTKPVIAAPSSKPLPPVPAAHSAIASGIPSPQPPATAARSDSPARPPVRDILMSLSIDPIRAQDLMTLLSGNRQGAFSITPLDIRRGSPGGLLTGEDSVGKNGSGTGGDASVAAGKETAGGAGPGATDTRAVLSINGDAPPFSAAAGSLPPLALDRLIYPINVAALGLRRSGFVVSAGPGGGGGLPVFGVLHGHRIYTIYLPMPGKNWILQYCAANDYHLPTLSSQTIEIHMEAPLVPPAALDQFDFHRPPLEGDNAGRMIILRGVIRQDGSVGDLQVLQAVAQPSDQAATAAFGRWKFTPALRAGNPVPVEVLVGIPAVEPGAP
jgi:hypothetical protein